MMSLALMSSGMSTLTKSSGSSSSRRLYLSEREGRREGGRGRRRKGREGGRKDGEEGGGEQEREEGEEGGRDGENRDR